MTVGDEIHAAIARHDATALRGMAKKTHDEETQMFLTLLADIIDQHLKSSQPAARFRAA